MFPTGPEKYEEYGREVHIEEFARIQRKHANSIVKTLNLLFLLQKLYDNAYQ